MAHLCVVSVPVCICAQLCPALCDPVDSSLSGSSVHGLSRQEYWSGLPFPPQGDLPEQGSNLCLLCLLHWQAVSLPLHHLGGPECWIDYNFSMEISMDSGKLEVIVLCVQEQGRTCSWVVLILKQWVKLPGCNCGHDLVQTLEWIVCSSMNLNLLWVQEPGQLFPGFRVSMPVRVVLANVWFLDQT